MDTSAFFAYPTSPHQPHAPVVAFLGDATETDWDTMLSYTQTRRLRAGEVAFTEGDEDRALYLLATGRVEIRSARSRQPSVTAPTPLNELAFLDGGRCAATARAATDCELLRLSPEAFESLGTREPHLARAIILDLARVVARTLRAASA
jgi:CRP-like cAMP-binding protein